MDLTTVLIVGLIVLSVVAVIWYTSRHPGAPGGGGNDDDVIDPLDPPVK